MILSTNKVRNIVRLHVTITYSTDGTVNILTLSNHSNYVTSTLYVKGKGFSPQAWCGSWGSRRLRLLDRLDIRHYEGGKVVTLTHRPSLPPGVFPVLTFRGWVDPRAHGSVGSFGKNPQWQHWGSIRRPSLTTTLSQAPHTICTIL
jgi:hypothetical protein